MGFWRAGKSCDGDLKHQTSDACKETTKASRRELSAFDFDREGDYRDGRRSRNLAETRIRVSSVQRGRNADDGHHAEHGSHPLIVSVSFEMRLELLIHGCPQVSMFLALSTLHKK